MDNHLFVGHGPCYYRTMEIRAPPQEDAKQDGYHNTFFQQLFSPSGRFFVHHVINYRTTDFAEAVMATTDHQGVDVILDIVGLPYLEPHLGILRRDGRLVFIALSGGSRGEIDLSPILTKRLRLSGSAMRPRTVAEKRALRDALAQHIWPELDRGRLLPHIGARFPLAEAARAHALMESGDHRGKIVLAVKP